MKEKENKRTRDTGCQINKRRTSVEVAKLKELMRRSGRRDICRG